MVLFSATADGWAVEEYLGVEEVLDELGVVQNDGVVVHREERGEPACTTGSMSRWRVVDTTDARRSGYRLCRNCYRPVFSYLARRPESPVERVENESEVDEAPTAAIADGGGTANIREEEDGRLDSTTEEVLVAGSGRRYHAPTGDGPLCGEDADMRRVEHRAIEGHYPPCRDCFDLDA